MSHDGYDNDNSIQRRRDLEEKGTLILMGLRRLLDGIMAKDSPEFNADEVMSELADILLNFTRMCKRK